AGPPAASVQEGEAVENARDAADDGKTPGGKGPKCQMRQPEQHGRKNQTDGFAPHSARQQALQEGSEEEFLCQRHHPHKSEERSDYKQREFPPFLRRRLEMSEVQQISDGRAHWKEEQVLPDTDAPLV